MRFSHIGITSDDEHPGETWVGATRVWVTDHASHPFHVEWLRYAHDSPVTGPVRDVPHVAYIVDSIEKAAAGMESLLEPFFVGDLRVGFYGGEDGSVIEFAEEHVPGAGA